MNIAIDGTVLYGAYCGPQHSLWNLLRALARVDSANAYTVYIPHDGPSAADRELYPASWTWKVLPFPGGHKLKRILWQQFIFPRLLATGPCDLVYSPTYVAPLRAPIPVVLAVHDLIALRQPQFARFSNRIHYRIMQKRSIKKAARIIVPSESVAEDVSYLVPRAFNRIHVVPHGVDDLFRTGTEPVMLAQVRVRYNLPDNFILFVGNFEPKKNLDNILQAMDLAPDLPLLVIAGGGMSWGAAAQHLLGNRGATPGSRRPHVLGYVPTQALPALYQLCDLFLFPSLAEGFGLPVLEALASGAPVLTSRAIKLPDVDHAVAFCEPTAPADIAARAKQLINDPSRREALRSAGKEYAAPFTWDTAARRTLDVYSLAAEEPRLQYRAR